MDSYVYKKEINFKGKPYTLFFDFLNRNIDFQEKNIAKINRRSIIIDNKKNKNLHIDIIPTYLCNLKCKYCFSEEIKSKNINNDSNSINIDYIKDFIIWYFQQIKAEKLSIGFIGGGEPLLKLTYIANLITLFKNSINQDFHHIGIMTNGLLLNKKIISNIVSLFDDVTFNFTVSVNSYNYKYIKKIIENFNKIKQIIKDKASLQIIIYAHEQPIDELKDVISYIKENEVFIKSVTLRAPVSEICKGPDNYIFDSKKYFDVLPYFYKCFPNFNIFNVINSCSSLRSKNYLAIDYKGNIFKCHTQSGNETFNICNVFDKDFDLLNNKIEIKVREFNYPNVCTDCDFFPLCKGGCFPYGYPNNFNDKRICIYYNFIEKNIEFFINYLSENESIIN